MTMLLNTAHNTKLRRDPGNGKALPIDKGNTTINLVTAGAETRTLARPKIEGQLLQLNLKTDGGDCVITVTGGVNQTGNNTMTFADAGDMLLLIAGCSGSNLVWRVASNDGVALSTV